MRKDSTHPVQCMIRRSVLVQEGTDFQQVFTCLRIVKSRPAVMIKQAVNALTGGLELENQFHDIDPVMNHGTVKQGQGIDFTLTTIPDE